MFLLFTKSMGQKCANLDYHMALSSQTKEKWPLTDGPTKEEICFDQP